MDGGGGGLGLNPPKQVGLQLTRFPLTANP